MNVEELIYAIGKVDEKYIGEVITNSKKIISWRWIVALAACLCVVISAVFFWGDFGGYVVNSTQGGYIGPSSRQPLFFYKGNVYLAEGSYTYELLDEYCNSNEIITMDYSLNRDDFEGNMSGTVYWNPKNLRVMYVKTKISDDEYDSRYIKYVNNGKIDNGLPMHFFYGGRVYVLTSMYYSEIPEGYVYFGNVKNIGNRLSGIDFEGNFEGTVYINEKDNDFACLEDKVNDEVTLYYILKIRDFE